MFLRQIFLNKPLVAIAVLVCLGTLLALFKANRRKLYSKSDRFLIIFIGMLAIYEAFRLMRISGMVALEMNSFLNDAIELLVAAACLAAAVLLRASQVDQLAVESAMRLARAAPPRIGRTDLPMMSKDLSSADLLSWAVPRFSDGAFRLLAMLCLRSESSSGRVLVGVTEMQLQLGKSKEELEGYLTELENAGVALVNRLGGNLEVEVLTQARRSLNAEAAVHPVALATESRL